MSISTKIVNRPVLITVIFALIMIVGLYVIGDISIALMPDTDRPNLMVNTSYSNASPESVEKNVTEILESALVNVSGLKSMTSTSSEGSSVVNLEFEYNTNLDEATNDIRDKIDQVRSSLPDEASTPRIFKFSSSDMPIMRIAISGQRASEELKSIAEDIICPSLEQVNGIAQADVMGGREKIVNVELSQNRLDAYSLTISSVSNSIAQENVELGGGSITERNINYLIRTMGEFKSLDEIRNTVVATKNGYNVKLSDIATISEGYEDSSSAVYINGNQGVYISLSKQSGSNSIKAANDVYEKIEKIKTLIPNDIELTIVSDDTSSIRSTINNLIESAILGAVLAMIILFLFLRSIKSTIIIGISIPFSILVTLLAMYFAGITLNMMTMTGLILGVGMIVDASIVILENIYHYRERGTKPKVAAIIGSQEMTSSIVASTLTTMFVFIPVLFFKSDLDMLGEMFSNIAFTIIISLASSLLVAIFLVPVLASKYLTLTTRQEKPLKNKILIAMDNFLESIMNAFTKGYKTLLSSAVNHRGITVMIVLGLFILSLCFIPSMNINLMPSSEESSITLNISLATGTALEETTKVIRSFEEIALSELQGTKTIISTIGGGGMGRNSSTYTGEISIQLPDYESRIDSAETMQKKLRSHFQDYPNVTFSFSNGMMARMSGSDIDIAIRTQDLDEGLSFSHSLVKLIEENIHDLQDTTIDVNEGLPQVEINIDRQRAADLGVSISSVAQEVSAYINGKTSTTYRTDGEELNIKLIIEESDRQKVLDLEKVYVIGNSGRVALSNFASIEKGVGPVSITRENQSRIIHLTSSLNSNRRAGDVENEIKELISDNIIIPDGISLSYEGSWQNITEMGKVFLLIITMALLLVFGVMATQYESFKSPFINMFTIPLLVIGVVAVYVISGKALTMFTAIAVVMLVGIVVNNGIVLVDYTNLLVSRGMPVKEACINSGVSRLRPVVMTTLTTILGLLPMAFSKGENSQMIQAIGLTVLGGLSSAAFITLFFIPVIYSLFNEKRNNKNHIGDK